MNLYFFTHFFDTVKLEIFASDLFFVIVLKNAKTNIHDIFAYHYNI